MRMVLRCRGDPLRNVRQRAVRAVSLVAVCWLQAPAMESLDMVIACGFMTLRLTVFDCY